MPDLEVTASTLCKGQTAPVSQTQQPAGITESADAAAGSTSPTLVPSTLIHTVRDCREPDVISKQNEEPPDQLPMVPIESSEVEKPTKAATKAATKRLPSPTRLSIPPRKRVRLADSTSQACVPQEGSSTSTTSTPPPIPSFISYELKQGPPTFRWRDFKHPQLRRFPGSLPTSKWRYVGAGIDGLVLRSRTDDGKRVALKIFFKTEQPEDFEGLSCYWAFKRECRNGAIVDMVAASLQHAAANGKSIHLNPKPINREDAMRNLKSFSTEHSDDNPEYFEPFILKTNVNPCHGWTVVEGSAINQILYNLREVPVLQSKRYFAIVYDYVSMGKLDDSTVQAQLDFFYLLGFIPAPFEERNWRGSGTLVDFSDLVPPHSREWRDRDYGRMAKVKIRNRERYTICYTVRPKAHQGKKPPHNDFTEDEARD